MTAGRPHVFVLILGLAASGAVQAQSTNCRAIADSLERLRCYDAQADKPSATPAPAPAPAAKAPQPARVAEDPLIAKAKSAVKRQLRDPDSARFEGIKTKTVGGKVGLCGQVNAKNAMGGMTGFIPFAYDGERAHILAFNAGPGNPTTLDADLLAITAGSRLKAHETWCK